MRKKFDAKNSCTEIFIKSETSVEKNFVAFE